MKIYILKCINKNEWFYPWYDKVDKVVVRAESEDAARGLASKYHGDEGIDCWFNKKKTSCDVLTKDGESQVIIQHILYG